MRLANSYNNHTKFLEINHETETIRIVEKNGRGHIMCASEFNQFYCGSDAMRLTAHIFGYEFHHGSQLISVFKEISK